MPVIDLAHFDAQIIDRLSTITIVSKVYDLEVDDTPEQIPGQAGRVRPYLVYQAPAPDGQTMVELADDGDEVIWRPRIKCVAAYRHDVVNLVGQVRAVLQRWAPTAPDGVPVSVSPLKPPFGFTGGAVVMDRSETPPRPWVGLQYESVLSL